jgi:hypothetical protein
VRRASSCAGAPICAFGGRLANQCREIAQAQRVGNLQETRDIAEPRVNNAGRTDFGKSQM